ncbi:hypothetical protein K7X08_032219 [Anisodus acutangulus]|uniref:Uncharacterized protein n=1 Tax=Anisodus acutangulus TaxID=402998 RepID=A0A9Q1MF61_9SOLA|nr:hypothetical protein K7X08_032219 [Anisodus acutangulus]
MFPFKSNHQTLKPQVSIQPEEDVSDPFIVARDSPTIIADALPSDVSTVDPKSVMTRELPTIVAEPLHIVHSPERAADVGFPTAVDPDVGHAPQPITPSQVSQNTRKSTRLSKTSAWLNNFIHRSSKPNISSFTYPLSNSMYYAAIDRRNDEGDLVLAFSSPIHCISNIEAEAMAARQGLKLCVQKN